MVSLEIDFNKDFDHILIRRLSNYRIEINPSEQSEEIRHRYFNFSRRIIQPFKRQIFISKEFDCPTQYEQGLHIIKAKFQQGNTVYWHLSKNITNIDFNDYLLNDWDIHHLHLGTEREPNGFFKRTTEVLFIRVTDTSVFFLNILPHNFSDKDLLRIVHNNWPETIEQYLSGFQNLSHNLSNEEVSLARKAGLLILHEIEDGVVYLPPGGGLSTARTSILASKTSGYYSRTINTLEKHVKNNVLMFKKQIETARRKQVSKLKMKLSIDEDGNFYCMEQINKVSFPLGKY